MTTPDSKPQQLPRYLSDRFIRYLNDRGYQPILVPRGGIVPPMVCLLDSERGRYEFRNKLANLLTRPAPGLDFTEAPAPEFNQAKISKSGGQVSIGFLQSIGKVFGAPKLDVSAEADRNNTFNFQDVIVRSVLTGPIESALQSGVKPEKLETTTISRLAACTSRMISYMRARSRCRAARAQKEKAPPVRTEGPRRRSKLAFMLPEPTLTTPSMIMNPLPSHFALRR